MPAFLYGTSKPFTMYYETIQKSLKEFYGPLGVCDRPAGAYTLDTCSFSNFTNSQWLNGTILQNPLNG